MARDYLRWDNEDSDSNPIMEDMDMTIKTLLKLAAIAITVVIYYYLIVIIWAAT